MSVLIVLVVLALMIFLGRFIWKPLLYGIAGAIAIFMAVTIIVFIAALVV